MTLLIDLYNYKPPEELRFNYEQCYQVRRAACDSSVDFRRNMFHTEDREEAQDVITFQDKVWRKSGLGPNHTYLPKSLHPMHTTESADTSLEAGREEAHMCLTGAMEGLLQRTGLHPREIDILVTTCSIFCPTPSMASMVVNHFGMRPDVQSYHLGGMGCGNGVVAVNLIADMLKARPGAKAVLITTETTSYAAYFGKDKARQVTNTLFRMGAAAMLFSDRPVKGQAKYRLLRSYRVHTASREEAYRCIWYGSDDEKRVGVYLGKDLIAEVSRALTMALTKIAPHIMTTGQIAAYLVNAAQRAIRGPKAVPAYKPAFSRTITKFLIHAGGAKVLDGIGQELQLTERHLDSARAVLHDYGNISSSTTWYSLGYVETVEGIKRGQKVLQIGIGSGAKSGVCVWQALKGIRDVQDAWEHRVEPGEAERIKQQWRRAKHRSSLSAAGSWALLLGLLVLLAAVALAYVAPQLLEDLQQRVSVAVAAWQPARLLAGGAANDSCQASG